ncbi:MAG: VWA domain-containing protein [Acidobacteria bacterium]|nr:VWA domain-containing protein [Acidobacteriota bacterium]
MSRAAPSPIVENLVLFVRVLRRSGLAVSVGQSVDFMRAMKWIDLGERDQVFHAARATLVSRCEDLDLFSHLFDLFWRVPGKIAGARRRPASLALRHGPRSSRNLSLTSFLTARAGSHEPQVELSDRSGAYSDLEVLQHKDFGAMTEEELHEVRRLIAQTRWRVSQRRTRRMVCRQRGERLDLRGVLRRASRRGGTAIELAWRSRKVKQRPVVLLADISGSMERYSRLVLQLFYSLSHSLRDVESFVFGTRLTRVTPHLRLRNADRALTEASREVLDWSGGTRIGESLHAFNRVWSRRILRRGAVVLIVSDGWDRGNSELLKRAMRFLRDRCHRLVWLNPLLGARRYEPLVAGMAAALPFVDDFLPVHNLRSLEGLASHLASLPERARGFVSAPRGTRRSNLRTSERKSTMAALGSTNPRELNR